MIIGVDHGYSAMKTAHICFPSGIVRYEHEPYTNRGVLKIGIIMSAVQGDSRFCVRRPRMISIIY